MTIRVCCLAAFTYSPELHDVVEVTEAGYDACSSANNISAFRTGNDVVPLAAVGTRYFLCGFTGHCGNGMKIRVDVVDGGAASGPAASSSSTTAASPAAAAGLGSGLLVAVLAATFW
jgi:hypothetical protein